MFSDTSTSDNRSPHIRSAVTNGKRLLAGVDGRSATARRFRDLIAELTIEAGGGEGLSAAQRSAIRQAAAILLRAEQVQADIVKGEPVDNDVLIRLSGEARRVLAGLRKRAPSPPGSLLQNHLRNRERKPAGELSEASA